ncbi:hypothetical protein Fmac_019228 [Flemingia macrophylla]|uniref:Uncharacterized protein n=1 Tax=Flemingia macrophylla TaxID=520843 RepID=A0ABD1M757_9FABA
MARELLSLPLSLATPQIRHRSHIQMHHRHVNTKSFNRSGQLIIRATTKQDTQLTLKENRRSGNYKPDLWTHEFIHSLGNHPQQVEAMQERATKLEERVRRMINRTEMEPRSLVQLIDDVQRLGLSYKFEQDINRALHMIVSTEYFKDQTQKTLHETALLFRILRQHGFHVSQGLISTYVFKSFKDEEGKFRAEISNDVRGLLSLYEASYLAFEGESLWEEANEFSRTHLMNIVKEGIDGEIGEQVRHVLEGLPYHQNISKLEARWYIDMYNKMESHSRSLLELAKLDFNVVQSSYQKELQEVLRWYMHTGVSSKLNFARSRIVENFFWAAAMFPEPQYANCRNELTKVGMLTTIIDDLYDVYGTLDELELFTDAVERWDLKAINSFPDHLILCFLTLYNGVNAMVYDKFKEQGINSLPYLTKVWSDLCKAYLQEARWFHNKVIPPFNKFLENGWISSSGGTFLIHSYFLIIQDKDITKQALHSLNNYCDLLRSAMTFFRLNNDLGTSTDEIERGEISNSVVSYLHETGLSKENCHQYYKTLIDKEWLNLNKYVAMDSTFSKSYKQFVVNFARLCRYTYLHGDGFARQDISKREIESLLVHSIPIDVALS